MLTDPALSHVNFDISWDEVAKYAVAYAGVNRARRRRCSIDYPDRFLFGTDTVAPAGPAPYFAVYDMWAPVWRRLTPDASLKVRKGNYERMFDEGRQASPRVGSSEREMTPGQETGSATCRWQRRCNVGGSTWVDVGVLVCPAVACSVWGRYAAGTSSAQSRRRSSRRSTRAYAKFKTLQEGKNADYIPALAKVDPNLFGIALVTADGKVYTAGDIKTEVSIQSISKVFTMAQVIQEQGLESIEKRIGVDATGARFNSIIAVEGVRTSSAPARRK